MNPAQIRVLMGGSLIALLTIVAYLPALRGDFIWDDDAYVTRNATLSTPGGLARIWTDTDATPQYYPLVFTTFWIERHLWGLHPLGYHVVNVLLHVASAVLLWRILLRLRIPGAFLAAMIFALHPVHVESVAWITERKNVLAGCFYLLSLRAYWFFSTNPVQPKSDRSRRRYYLLSIALFAGALLSKSVTASLPAVILLLIWWKKDRLSVHDVLPLLPHFAMGLAMGLTTTWLEQHHVGATKVQWGLSFTDRILIAGQAVWFYLGKLVWPYPLMFTYPRWEIDAHDPLQWVFPITAVLLLAVLWLLRRSFGKAPLFASLVFVGTLFPALGFINVYPMIFSYVADHFQYLASIGPIAMMSALLASQLNIRSPAARAAGAACILLPLGALTWRQGTIYRDLETLWRDTLAKNDDAWMAHYNLGALLNTTKRTDEAARHYERAIELNPKSPAGYNGLADVRIQQERLDEAADLLGRALRIDPTFAFTHSHLGALSERENRPDVAVEHYRRALELKPDLADAHNSLAILLEQRGDIDSAITHYTRAIESYPSLGNEQSQALVHQNLGSLFENRGRMDKAIEHFRQAVALKPDYGEAHLKLANLLYRRRRIVEAARHYEQAVLRLPTVAQARYNYGVALSELHRMGEAARQFSEALRIKPDYVEARFGLARLLEIRGRANEALREYETILLAHPDHAPSRGRWTALRGRSDSTSGPTSHTRDASIPTSHPSREFE